MNLYRSFGNLMEAWVNEESATQSRLLRNNAVDVLTPTFKMGINPRSDSVDSGVGSATSSSVSTENTEMDSFTLQSEGLTQVSTSESPDLVSPATSSSSSSSPRLCPSRTEEKSPALNTKVEQALQRTLTKSWKSVDEMLVRLPRAAFVPKRHTSELVRCPRSQRFDMRKRFSPSISLKQMCEMQRPSEEQRSEGLKDGKELSPGLFYLEQVCQMLEKIAKQQMCSQTSQMETDVFWEHEETQASETCQPDSAAAEEDESRVGGLVNAENAEPVSGEAPVPRRNRHFRQRSASDTTFLAMNLKKLNTNSRGQLMSTNNLLETVEEDSVTQETAREGSSRSFKNWRLKLGNLRRSESDASESKSQQMPLSEKNSTRRRLSQLFRRKKAQTVDILV